ncbi:MAG: hypothetical protein AAFV53_24270 [Myxococcota bacterium]
METPPLGRIQVQTSIEGVEVTLPLALRAALIAWLVGWMLLVFGLVLWNFPKGPVWGVVMGLIGAGAVSVPAIVSGLALDAAIRKLHTGQMDGALGINVLAVILGAILWSTSLFGALVFFTFLGALNGGMWWLSRRSWSLFIGQGTLTLRFQGRTHRTLPLEELDVHNLPRALRRQVQALEEEERVWLEDILTAHSVRRKAALNEAGHDLSAPAPLPDELQGLRSVARETPH